MGETKKYPNFFFTVNNMIYIRDSNKTGWIEKIYLNYKTILETVKNGSTLKFVVQHYLFLIWEFCPCTIYGAYLNLTFIFINLKRGAIDKCTSYMYTNVI